MKKASIEKKVSLPVLTTIGHHLKLLRLAKGYDTQEQFAAAHDLPRIQYWRLEKGVANLTFKTLARVLAIHDLTIEEFFAMILKKKNGRLNKES